MLSLSNLLLTLVAIVVTLRGSCEGATDPAPKKWWETASFYQIYPRSFKDSNGDGIGDLKGVTEKLEYLKEIGITAAWLSPIFASPMVDFGYDVSNFTGIDPTFGTMEDFEALLAKAKKIGIKIILDFVPNHSSDECEWFIKSAANDPEYKDLYVWHPGKFVNGIRQEPTNWRSVFRGSQWTWHEGRQQYYLHQFHRKQPDFDFRNPKVLELMKDVLRFWIRKGVDGFRVDAVPFLFESGPDENGNLPDEPRNPSINDPLDHNYVYHVHTVDLPENTGLIYEFRSVLEEMKAELGTDDLVLMTEAYSSIQINMGFYGNATMEGSHIPFNFELIVGLGSDPKNAKRYVELIKLWLDNLPKGRTANWVLGNHDQMRIGTRFGTSAIDRINMLLLTLPGCSVTYYGEEIGMTNVWISWEDTVDPQACQSTPEEYEFKSRDPQRTPLQWDDGENAGFTTANRTWLPLSDNYETVNVKSQRRYDRSHLNVFKQLGKLRLETTMQHGNTEVEAFGENVLAIKRSYNEHPTYLTLINFANRMVFLNVTYFFEDLTKRMEYVIVTEKSVRRKGEKVRTNSILLLPEESVILRTVW